MFPKITLSLTKSSWCCLLGWIHDYGGNSLFLFWTERENGESVLAQGEIWSLPGPAESSTPSPRGVGCGLVVILVVGGRLDQVNWRSFPTLVTLWCPFGARRRRFRQKPWRARRMPPAVAVARPPSAARRAVRSSGLPPAPARTEAPLSPKLPRVMHSDLPHPRTSRDGFFLLQGCCRRQGERCG